MATESYMQRILESIPRPDFGNLLAVLRQERPTRPTLFEFFLNGRLYQTLSAGRYTPRGDELDNARMLIVAFRQAGYDYVTYRPEAFCFPTGTHERDQTISLNDGAVITDWASFEAYRWVEPDECDDYALLDAVGRELPEGMRIVVPGPGGVLENAIRLVGYDNLCFMLADDPPLAEAIFAAIGSRLVRHYERACQHERVGACISNDDWGFKTQPMLSPADLRRYVFPWHKRIVAAIHAAGRPAILHSCGNAAEIMDDIVREMAFDGKHSYEDTIQTVEEAYRLYGEQIGILGGIDVDFVIRSEPAAVYRRSRRMLERAEQRGSYALGTGNSVPEYVPDEHYAAMIWAALETR